MTCRCQKVVLEVEGKTVEGVVRRAPDCGRHGRGDRWHADDPLQKYAKEIEGEVTYGPFGQRGYSWTETVRRLETPREVEARLLAELTGPEAA